MPRRVMSVLLGVVALALVAGTAVAQDPVAVTSGGAQIRRSGNEAMQRMGVILQVYAGYGGAFRPGRWTPVDVVIRTHELRPVADMVGENLQGELRITIETGVEATEVHERRLDVPMLGERRASFVVLPETDTILVEFIPHKGIQAYATTGAYLDPVGGTVRLSEAAPDSVLVAVMRYNERALRRVSSTAAGGAVAVAPITPDAMPGTPGGWTGADAVVAGLHEFAALRPDVQDALMLWTRSGGHLLLTYDGVFPQLSQEVARALPGALGIGRRTRLDAGVEQFGEHPLPDGAQDVVVVDQIDPVGEVLVEVRGRPLIVRRPLDSGFITLVGTSLAAPPLLGWDGLPALWGKLLPQVAIADVGSTGIQIPLINAFLGFRDLSPAGLTGVLTAFACYAAALGAGLSWLLRRARRAQWYWPVTGTVIGVVAIFTIAMPNVLAVDTPATQTVTVVRARSGAQLGRYETYAAATAHTHTTTDLRVAVEDAGTRTLPDPRELTIGARETRVTYAPEPIAREIAIGPDTTTMVVSGGIFDPVPPVRFVREPGGGFRVKNDSLLPLTGAIFVTEDGAALVGDVPPHTELPLRLTGDGNFYTWEQWAQTQKLGWLFPGFFEVVTNPTNIPDAMRSLMLQMSGVEYLGARLRGPLLVAWRAAAPVGAGRADDLAEHLGYTILVLEPEQAS